MNYKLHYDKLIHRAQNRSILKSEYKEIHHIIPKCMGGSDLKENLTPLFPEEHIIAHLLLTKIYPNNYKLLQSAHCMTNGFNKSIKSNNKKYRWLKIKNSEYMSRFMTENHYLNKMTSVERIEFINKHIKGMNNPNFGNTWSNKQKEDLSRLNKNYFIAVDQNGVKERITINDTRYISGELVAESKGRRYGPETKALKSFQTKGSSNPNAKEYKIINSEGIIVYNGIGGVVSYLSNNSIPKSAVYKAIQNDTTMYATKQAKTLATKNGNAHFIGWRFERV